MPRIHLAERRLILTVAFCGANRAGLTNLSFFRGVSRAQSRALSPFRPARQDRRLVALELGEVDGFSVRAHLVAVPHASTDIQARDLMLGLADVVVFAADATASADAEAANGVALAQLENALHMRGRGLGNVPHVVQYLHREYRNSSSSERLRSLYNTHNAPDFAVSPTCGGGVLETWQASLSLAVARWSSERTSRLQAA